MTDANSRRVVVTSQTPSKLAPEQCQPAEEAQFPRMAVPRRVFVKGMQGVDATVVVTVVQGKVWLSISPPFSWEAIMGRGKSTT